MEKQASRMKLPTTSSAKDALLFANTPTFLVNRLQVDPMVQYASRLLPPELLFSTLKAELNIAPIDPEDLIKRYVFLISLSVSADQELWHQIRKLPLFQLEWGNEIYALLDMKRGDAFRAGKDTHKQQLKRSSNALNVMQDITFKVG